MDFWETLVNAKTLQRVTDKYTANFRGIDLQLKEKLNNDGYRLEAKGSLHKCYNYGLHNADQFTFAKLVQSIDGLTDVMGINANKCELHGVEVGLNIPLPFAPGLLLKNLVSYGGKGFTLINKKEPKKGLQCALTQYALKVYDKGRQAKQPGNILRLEISVNKMQAVEKYGLHTLADLQLPEKVYPLVTILTDAVSRIIWTDNKADLNQMSDREQKQWLYYSNARTWENMNRKQRNYHLAKWNLRQSKYGSNYDLQTLVLQTWNRLFDGETIQDLKAAKQQNEAEKLGRSYRVVSKNEAEKNGTFLPLECHVKTSHNNTHKNTTNNINNNINIYSAKTTKKSRPPNKKYCATCGADISHQRKQSRFCSATYVGERKAKKCRNKESNRRRDFKNKITNAMDKEHYLQITYTDENGMSYTDVLHATELSITRQWLDRITQIKVFHQH